MTRPIINAPRLLIALLVFAAWHLAACGSGDTPHNVNLLDNGSFEEMDGDLPKNWKLNNFRGLKDMRASEYGMDTSDAFDGERSFFFKADSTTRRFFMLSQEIRVKNVTRVRLRAALKGENVDRLGGQYPQANLALTFYDQDRNRFMTQRFADRRTQVRMGSTDGWVLEDRLFKIPPTTAYIVVHCVLGMSGTMWYDSLSLEVPEDVPWLERDGEIFTHYYLPGQDYPEGSIEFQRQLYDQYASRLGVPVAERQPIRYYFYGDSATFLNLLGVKGTDVYCDFDNREIHSVHPADDHEVIHMLTHPFGSLPVALAEGTAYYILDDYHGEAIQPLAQRMLKAGRLPALRSLLDAGVMKQLPPDVLVVGAASFIGYLVEFGGTERFLRLHTEANGTMTYNTFKVAFERTYGGSLEEAEEVWRKTLASADFSPWQETEGQK